MFRAAVPLALAAAIPSAPANFAHPASVANAAQPTSTAQPVPVAFSPSEWRVDHTERRFYTVRFNRQICDGFVSATIYGHGTKNVTGFSEFITGCRSSYTFDVEMYDFNAWGSFGPGNVKVELSDYASGQYGITRTLPFSIKANSTQSIRSSRSGSYVNLGGTTMRYTLPTQYGGYWTPAAGVQVQYQKLVGKTWTTVRTLTTDKKGNSSARLRASSRATYRVVFPATGFSTLGGSNSVNKVQ